jgi:hypothetical protein
MVIFVSDPSLWQPFQNFEGRINIKIQLKTENQLEIHKF